MRHTSVSENVEPNKARATSILLAVALLLISICGCERIQRSIPSERIQEEESSPDAMLVSIIYPGDCLGDSSYCDILYNGVQRAKTELGVEIAEVESGADTWEMQLREAAKQSGLVITAGFQMREPISRVAPEFRDVKFVIFDAEVDLPNVVAFSHRANEGAFLVGAIAALKSQTGKVGYLGGADVPLLHQFEAGYIAGAKAVNPDAQIFKSYVADDEQGFYQPEKAIEIATTQYENGVDVIYSMADRSGFGAVEAAKIAPNRYVIWTYININDVASQIALTSLLIRIDQSAYNVIRAFVAGQWMPAGIYSLGLAEDGVGYALDEQLSDETIEIVESLKRKIISGEIVVPTEPMPSAE